MSEHFDAADIAQAVEEAAIKSDIAPTKVDRRLVAAHDRIEKLEQQLAVSQSMQCTSPFEDSPPCRGIQRVKDELANATKQIALLREALEKIACLGNGDKHGNSIGNCMAIDALAAIDKELGE